MSQSVVAIIQARLGSTRLPRKILEDVCGRPLLQHVIDRARAIKGVDDVVVAVPDEATRLQLKAVGIASISTPKVAEQNVLGRFATIADQFRSHDAFMRLTGDCPLLDPAIAEAVLALFAQQGVGYAWNDTTSSGYPDGTDVEVFDRDLLMLAHREATEPEDLEHVGLWMRRAVVPLVLTTAKGPTIKLSVDTPEDLERVRAIMAKLPKGDYSLAATMKAAKGLA